MWVERDGFWWLPGVGWELEDSPFVFVSGGVEEDDEAVSDILIEFLVSQILGSCRMKMTIRERILYSCLRQEHPQSLRRY
jgi:hypothetical protein